MAATIASISRETLWEMASTCDSSLIVANRLVELGYRNVRRYAEGKVDWMEAGLPVEGGAFRRGRSTADPSTARLVRCAPSSLSCGESTSAGRR
jgi:hypothetical protein